MKRIAIVFILLPFLAACSNSEKEARALLNKGIQQWDGGELEQALETFDLVGAQYLDTVAATEAIKERTTRLDNYRALSSSEHNREKNNGIVSRDVYQQVEGYFNRTGRYPEKLHGEEKVYTGRFETYVEHCTYQKSLLDYGYQLNCTDADHAFMESRNQRPRQGVEKQAATRAPVPAPAEVAIAPSIRTAADLDPAETSWGENLNPNGKLPKDGFQAFYINTDQPHNVIATESVDSIAINYIYDQFHGIESGDFGAYWVGNLEFETQEVMRIAVSQSWSKARILINGQVLFEGGSDYSVLYRFEPGLHKIEVEYVNNWHTTEFSVDINAEVTYLNLDEIKARLKSNLLGDYQAYYAGVYESSSKDLTTVVNLGKTAHPVLLVFSSYSPVKWYLSNPYGVDVRAIVYGSYKPGSSVAGDIPDGVLRFAASSRIGTYDANPRCRCTAGSFHCEGTGMISTIEGLQTLTEKPLTGFTGEYSAASLTLPEVRVDDRYLEDLKNKIGEIDAQRAACKSENDPDFDAMFEKRAL